MATFVFALLLLEALVRIATPLAARLDLDFKPLDAVYSDQTARALALLEATESRTVLDTLLGWRYRPRFESATDRLNSAGMRAAREYSPDKPAGHFRVAAFGDSFVYGNEVTNAEAWSTRTEELHPSLEVMNYGVGGYGTDQAFLLFLREGSALSPDVVLIGFAPVNLRRAVNVYRRFISTEEYALVKPRFRLRGDSTLELLPNPLPTRDDWRRLIDDPAATARDLGAHDAWYDPIRYEFSSLDWWATFRLGRALGVRTWRKYMWRDRLLSGGQFREASEAYRVQRAIFRAFADSVRARGAEPVILMFPDSHSVLHADALSETVYAPLRAMLEREKIAPVLDLQRAFLELARDQRTSALIAPGGHYSAVGNEVVAQWIGRELLALRSQTGVAPE